MLLRVAGARACAWRQARDEGIAQALIGRVRGCANLGARPVHQHRLSAQAQQRRNAQRQQVPPCCHQAAHQHPRCQRLQLRARGYLLGLFLHWPGEHWLHELPAVKSPTAAESELSQSSV